MSFDFSITRVVAAFSSGVPATNRLR